MVPLLLAVLFAAPVSQGAPADAPAQERDIRRYQTLMRFALLVEDAARTLKSPGRIVLARTEAALKGDPGLPAAVAKLPDGDPLKSKGDYVMYVRNAFLDDHPDGALEETAAHEVCHVVLGHLESEDNADEDAEEVQAEYCAYLYMGEDAFVAFMRAHAAHRAAKDGTYREFAEMPELEFRNLIRKAFGLGPVTRP